MNTHYEYRSRLLLHEVDTYGAARERLKNVWKQLSISCRSVYRDGFLFRLMKVFVLKCYSYYTYMKYITYMSLSLLDYIHMWIEQQNYIKWYLTVKVVQYVAKNKIPL